MILDKNAFIAVLLPKFIIRTLTPIKMDAYRLPFVEPESRWPTSIWPRELPIGGEAADVVKIEEDCGNGSCGLRCQSCSSTQSRDRC